MLHLSYKENVEFYFRLFHLQAPQQQRRRSSVGIAMDSLKSAADKIKKSPRVLKGKIDNALNKESKFYLFLSVPIFIIWKNLVLKEDFGV